MLIRALVMLAFAAVIGQPAESAADTRRYAVLIGLDEVPGRQLPPLRHAEREVRGLAEVLAERGRFDRSRIKVLVGQQVTHEGIVDAFGALQQQMRADAERAPDDETLLFIVWSGHGNAGELLTRSRPLTAETLWAQIARTKPTVQIGFFDSCFSGSLTAKGLRRVTPFNPLAQLPDAPLGTRGSFNVSSSTGDQLSFEHPDRGSLMLQTLARAFTDAAPRRSAVALEQDMLPYIVRRMSQLADDYGIEQTPQWKSDLVSTRPIYMSWPLDRSAQVELPDADVDCLEVEYTDSGYVERLSRPASGSVAIYARPSRLSPCDTTGVSLRVDRVEPGQTIVFSRGDRGVCHPRPGRCRSLADKSGGRVWLADDTATLHVGAGVAHAWRAEGEPAADTRGAVSVQGWLGRWGLSLGLAFGRGSGTVQTLGYEVSEFEGRLLAERTLYSGALLDLGVGLGPALVAETHRWQASRQGAAEISGVHPGAVALARAVVPLPSVSPWVYLTLAAGAGYQRRITGYGESGRAPPDAWRLAPMVELSLVSGRLPL